MNHIRIFLIYLLDNEVTLFKQGKITYLLNIFWRVIDTLLSFGTVFFAVFGLFTFFLVYSHAIDIPADMPASEIVIALKNVAYPMSLLTAILEVFIRKTFRFLNYLKYQWNIHNVAEVRYE